MFAMQLVENITTSREKNNNDTVTIQMFALRTRILFADTLTFGITISPLDYNFCL